MIQQLDPRTDKVREMTKAEYARFVEGQPFTFRQAPDQGPGSIQLWDNVDLAWTRPLPRDVAMEHYIHKEVIKCSNCRFTTVFNSGFAKHIERTQAQTEDHKGAAVERWVRAEDGQAGATCNGCGAKFISRATGGQRHLDEVREATRLHQTAAVPIIMLRFSRGPQMPVDVDNGHQSGPDASQETGMPAQPVHGKRRGRKRSRAR